MTLRTRLVASLVVLFAVGLVAFGAGTIRVFGSAEYSRLDRQLASSVDLYLRELTQDGGPTPIFGDADGDGRVEPGRGSGRGDRRDTLVAAPGTYAQLTDRNGVVRASLRVQEGAERPDLSGLGDGDRGPTTLPSVDGTTSWRTLARSVGAGGQMVVAIPTTSVRESLGRLLAIEALAGVVLLGLLAGGGFVLLRRGLRPLEEIAATATSIGAGELDRRVPHADEPSEVGQLAVAINGMLGDLETSFQERDATEARLRRFIADASHELRTPITSIQGFAELFRLGADSPHVDLPTTMRRIEQESARMGRLVEDLLTLARFDEREPPELADVDLAVLVADACSDTVAAAPDRRVSLDAPERLMVAANPDQLRQALGNLTRNAIRHAPAGTAVDVSLTRDGDDAVMSVRDHGPGLDADALAHVFDRFWQADRARVGTGAGLGLAITEAIAAAHKGSIEVANHADGGAVFSLRVPLAGPPA